MMDSRYCSFLPVPPSWCPDLSTAVSCDLASQCAVQVLMTTATSSVFSARDWERGRDTEMIFPRIRWFKCLHHPCKLREDLARECAGSRYNDSFLVEWQPFLEWSLINLVYCNSCYSKQLFRKKKKVVQTDIIRECFPTAMPIAEEEVDFTLLCFMDTWQPTV